MARRFPGRKLSIVRVIALCAAIAGIAVIAVSGWTRFEDARAATATPSFFSGYVDVTATPTLAFEDATVSKTKSVVLSFIVSDPDSACTPSWGGFYGLDEAGTSLDLDRRIARFVQNDGEVAISFGGMANSDLAIACTDSAKLKAAYQNVIDRYDITTIDLDIEGTDLGDTAAGVRRAEAIAAIQKKQIAANKHLDVWLTLPVAPNGLTDEGTTAVAQMLAAKVELSGVNVMTMDFNTGITTSAGMLDASISAAKATHEQVRVLYQATGADLGDKTLWRKIGLTPMIGQNDVPAEVFGLDAARGLNDFAQKTGVGRISMWSLNRDATCGGNYPDVKRVSDACSGIDQGDALFAELLASGITGGSSAATTTPSIAPSTAPNTAPRNTPDERSTPPVVDDPATSPYQIWTPQATYVAEDRVVWHGNVYVAKYWTLGDVPDNPSVRSSETPWDLIGPVLPGDKPQPVIEVPEGTYPKWSATAVYEMGGRVMFNGRIVEAKWWTQADSPQAALEGSNGSAWRKLTNDEVTAILTEKK
ncbi:chitinase [Homoserinimonas sp. OAct 916]|uniref:chitinase n=1 Tax=Homoserinimonas sp. OAct 916 TaxID=2211450 RepID=UPI000DBE065E|nr:glycosyl hydrolase family 18 [Homoserinimonas sp. OAct 916]